MSARTVGNPIFWTEEHCFRALYAWVREHGRVPSENGDWRNGGPNRPSGRTCRRVFGSWSRFIRMAGLEPRSAGQPAYWTHDLVAEWMLDYLLATGEWPTVHELRVATRKHRPSYCTITKLFGSFAAAKRYAGWNAACRQCGESLPGNARVSQIWCSNRCRRAHENGVPPYAAKETCVGCGCDHDAYVLGCVSCSHRKHNRSARARKLQAVAAPHLVESSPHRDSEEDALGEASRAATSRSSHNGGEAEAPPAQRRAA